MESIMEQYSYTFKLNAAECTPQGEMQLDKLATLIIEVATQHANRLGVGFDRLSLDNLSWVLSRLSIELTQPLLNNHTYRLETWVESLTRLYTERNFAIIDTGDDTVAGYVRTLWMAIDVDTRRPGNLSELMLADSINPRECPIAKQGKVGRVSEPQSTGHYEFVTSDIDINRHVTTRRYIDLIVDRRPLEFYDEYRIRRMDVAFKREAQYGEHATITAQQVDDTPTWDVVVECDGQQCVLARVAFTRR